MTPKSHIRSTFIHHCTLPLHIRGYRFGAALITWAYNHGLALDGWLVAITSVEQSRPRRPGRARPAWSSSVEDPAEPAGRLLSPMIANIYVVTFIGITTTVPYYT
jgi:hypothetical protein